MREDYKECPYCKERIKGEAVKCRYCGEFLSTPRPGSFSAQPKTGDKAKNYVPASNLVNVLGIIIIILSVYASLYVGGGAIGGIFSGAIVGLFVAFIQKNGNNNVTRAVALSLLGGIVLLVNGSTTFSSNTQVSGIMSESKGANRVLLQNCLDLAEENYATNWENNCKSYAKVLEDGYKNCLGPYTDEQFCRSLWAVPDSSPDCSLPSNNAQSVEDRRNQDRQECFVLYS